MARLVIVSYRVQIPPRGRARGETKSGGLAVGIADALKKARGLWFGWSGTTSAEAPIEAKVTEQSGITYAQVDIARQDHELFYAGFANATLWPLLHYRLGLVEFDRDALAAYERVNADMARALLPLLRDDDLVWVHDYQLIPFGQALRALGFRGRIGFFLHVPFPPASLWVALPQGDKLLESFLSYDLVGFQTQPDARNFSECMSRLMHLPAGENRIAPPGGREVLVGAFPIGIDTEGFATTARRSTDSVDVTRLRDSLGDRALVIGADRLDYSKGLPNRFRGFDHLLNRFPEHRRRVTYLQVAARSRSEVASYRSLRRELDQLAGRINGDHADFDWVPLRYLTHDIQRNTLAGFFRVSRVGLVTPMRDGMNLVAKEWVAAQEPDNPGVLVLSQFAGAALELPEALLVNPFDSQEIAEALHRALTMPQPERKERWDSMMERLRTTTAASWAAGFIERLSAPAREGTPIAA